MAEAALEKMQIINQPWEDVASDVTDAIEKAVQPLLKKAVDDIYGGLLDATQDYLKDNLAFNIASRIDVAEREAADARQKLANQRDVNAAMLAALHEGRRAIGEHFAPNDCYATGPVTGDAFRDLVQCPACSFISMYDEVIATGSAS